MGYFRLAVKSVSWVSAFRVSTRGIAFLRTIVLARILSPAQFGVFGIASLTITFLEILTETGVNIVLIQKKSGIEKYLNTAWVVSIIRGVIISAVLVLIAPLISSLFNSAGAKNLIYLVSIVSLLRGFINPAIVHFQKDLKFGQEFWFKFSIFLVDSTTAVIMALVLRSATGIVLGLIAGALFELVISYLFVRPWPRVEFDGRKLREILSSGKWVTGAGVFQFLFKQGDDAVVGRVLGESSLGIYQVAYKIASLPVSEITDVFGRVTFPLYVKLRGDKQRLRRAFLKTSGVVVLLSLFLGSVLFIFGEFIVLTVLGDAWREAVPLVRVLSVFGVVSAISNSMNSFLFALEKQHLVTLSTFVGIAVLGLSIFPLIYNYGLAGAVYAPLIGALVSLPVSVWFVADSLKAKQ